MTNIIEDGGGAFPREFSGTIEPGEYPQNKRIWLMADGGMSLRDYFAGQALLGWYARVPNETHLNDHAYQFYAIQFYAMADAMLAARKGPTA